MDTQTTILLIRHGAVSRVNNDGVQLVYGPNEALNNTGVMQVRELGRALSQFEEPSVIYTSPVIRAQQTAFLLQEAFSTHPPYIPREDLRPAAIPQWEGQPIADLVQTGIDLFARNPNLPDTYGETLDKVYRRSVNEFNAIKKDHEGETVAIVSHGEVIGMIQHYLRVGSEGEPGMDITIDKGESLRLRFGENGSLLDAIVISPEGQPTNPERR